MITLNTANRNSRNYGNKPAFGYNYPALRQDLAAKGKEFVFTVPSRQAMIRAVGIGVRESAKLYGFLVSPLIGFIAKLGFDMNGAEICRQELTHIANKNPLNLYALPTFAEIKGYFRQFK